MYFPDAKSQSVSSIGCRTSVGTLMDESTCRASSLLLIRRRSVSAPGLVLDRTHRRHQRWDSGSSAIEGESPRRLSSNHASLPNGVPLLSSMIVCHSSGVGDHGWSASPTNVEVVA